jgi:hypothetical protein
MPSSKIEPSEAQRTDEAWQRLQQRLALEPMQPKWASAGYGPSAAVPAEPDREGPAAADERAAQAPAPTPQPGDRADRRQPAARSRLRKGRRWAILAAACCVFAAIVATPAGSDALAAMLNKFRMQQVTVVQEDDLRSLFEQLAPEGQTREQINKFGSFSQTSGKLQGEYTPDEAAKLLGRKLIVPEAPTADGKAPKLYITPSNKLTFQINVAEVNGAMKRLGAKQLLPSSINGKPITLELGESAQFNIQDDSRKTWYSFTQQPVPVVTVDPSIPVSEALKSVLDFPLLPAHLKESLQQSDILGGGNVPMPVFAQGHADKVNVNGTEVVVTESARGDQASYEATWVKDGQLYQLSGGNRFTDKTSLLAKIKELMSQ